MEQKNNLIKNIVFDLGGVLIDLDIKRTGIAFEALGMSQPADEEEIKRRALIYSGLETGEISSEAFRKAIRDIAVTPPTDSAIDNAWNAMLLDFPPQRVEVLLNLRKRYRLFLLSNSNAIHHKSYSDKFRQDHGFEMSSLFEKEYYSFEMNMKKPSPVIFQKVLDESRIKADETLFIDDTLDNINAAAKIGFRVHHIVNGADITLLFRKGIQSVKIL
jgi:glucose-1-phosphatase